MCIRDSQKGSELGLALLQIDKEYFAARRMVILHLSTLNPDHFETFTRALIAQIFEKDPCDEVVLYLYHKENEEGKLAAVPRFKDLFTAVGFKWKFLTNDASTGKRYTILALRRPADVKMNGSEVATEPISFQSQVTLRVGAPGSTQISYPTRGRAPVYNPHGLINALNEVMKDNEGALAQLGSQAQLSTIHEKLSAWIGNKSSKFKYKDSKVLRAKTEQELNQFLDDNKVAVEAAARSSLTGALSTGDNELVMSAMHCIYRWKAFHTGSVSGDGGRQFKAIRIRSNYDGVVKAFSSYLNSHIYLIPLDDERLTIFLFELNGINKTEEEILQDLPKLFAGENEKIEEFDEVWIPMFQKKLQTAVKEFGGVQLQDGRSASEAYQNFLFSTEFTESLGGGLITKPSSGAHIISSSFFIGCIHQEINEFMQLPYFAAAIHPDEFVKV
eukprot:TRINITY_DN12508_c0_g1_i1.p1 TRINITY_DN12508_c0_g1~~TRINITY_DN12508_c0_g1_i1.p1  ORF type:complete len:464 (+),score=110.55 TRINITY_DN12508_c0_g1_i1:61-1392(+)